MKNIKKIKIKINGKLSTIQDNVTLYSYLKKLKVPLKKVAIELNQEIVDKNLLKKIKLKKNDKIEIVHFIGGG
jgi:sulfur carrier protein|tara:strand:- start:111 stop:329 length:219 start_codon:yes stop_codon:yes gene_type:complete